jgi:hypothetical protein
MPSDKRPFHIGSRQAGSFARNLPDRKATYKTEGGMKRLRAFFSAIGQAFRLLFISSHVKLVPIKGPLGCWFVDDPKYLICNFDSRDEAQTYIDALASPEASA